MNTRRWALACASIAASILAASSADAAQQALKLTLPATESLGQPIAVTAAGDTDGTLRLFLFADEQRRPCAATPMLEEHGSWELTPFGGEPLAAGVFSRTYSYTPQVQIAELCAYLDESASGTPALTARTPEPVREYLESEAEAPPFSSGTGELPGALKPLPVNEQVEKEYWARLEREQHERAQVRPVVPPCIVPRLARATLAAARRDLEAAGCTLGHVRRIRGRGRLVVLAQGTPAGRVLQGGAAVAVVLGARRR